MVAERKRCEWCKWSTSQYAGMDESGAAIVELHCRKKRGQVMRGGWCKQYEREAGADDEN